MHAIAKLLGRKFALCVGNPNSFSRADSPAFSALNPKRFPGRVLLVDDDPTFTSDAVDCLGQAGFDVSVATDGGQALKMLNEERYAVALVDLCMPQIDGLRLIELVRGDRRLRDLVISVVTARRCPDTWGKAIAIGANYCTSKPINWSILIERISGHASLNAG